MGRVGKVPDLTCSPGPWCIAPVRGLSAAANRASRALEPRYVLDRLRALVRTANYSRQPSVTSADNSARR